MNETPAPSPHFRTVQMRVPVFSAALVAAVVAGLLVVGGLAYGGYHVYQANARNVQARAEADASARELAARTGARLDAAEDGTRVLGQAVDKAITADSSDAINVNGYLDSEGRLHTVLIQVGPDVDAVVAAHGSFLSADRRRELDALRHRADGDADQLATLDARIQQAAQHRQKLAQAEAAAHAKAEAQAESRRASSAAASGPSSPPASTVYYESSPYYYPYGYDYPYYYGYGPSVWIGGSWGWGHGGGWHGGGGHGGGHHR